MRILIAERFGRLRMALRLLIVEKTDHVIAGEATDWSELVELERNADPDLILLDWDLPGSPAEGKIAALQTRESWPILIVLSTRNEVKDNALAAGADAFVSKGDSPEKLLTAMQEVIRDDG